MPTQNTQNNDLENRDIEQDLTFNENDIAPIAIELPNTDAHPRPVVACETHP
jgi:hypothetical protein